MATATSIDGRMFTFHFLVEGLELQPGSYAAIGDHLGQVHSVELQPGQRGEVHGRGMLLDGGVAPFHDLPIGRADQERVRAWLEEARPPRGAYEVGAGGGQSGVAGSRVS